MTQIKNSNCDKTQEPNLWQKLKTIFETRLENLN